MKRKGPRRDAAKERWWRGIIRAQRQSGQTIREYCREHALSEPSFYAWRHELNERRGQRAEHGQRASAVRRRKRRPVAATPAARGGQRAAAAFVPVRVATEVAPLSGYPLAGVAAIELALPSGAVLRWLAGVEPAAVAAIVSVWERSRC